MKAELKIPFFLLWCHLKRGNKWTLALIIFMMSIAFINLIFVNSLFSGIIKSSNQQIIDTYTGHIMMRPPVDKDYFKEADQVVKKIEEVPDVVAASAQMAIPGSLEYKKIKNTDPIMAVDPDVEKQVTNVSTMMQEGEYLNQDDVDEIIIGRQVAGGENVEMNALSFQDAKVGDKVLLNIGTVEKEFMIKGIFYTKFLETDKQAFITKKALASILPGQENLATTIIVKNKETGLESSVINQFKEKNIEAKYYSWKEMAGMMESITKSFFSINFILAIVAILIAAVTIFIVVYIDVTTKRQQVGILRAIGIKSYLIVFSYILQTIVYSMAGIALGSGLFFGVIVTYFQFYPFVLPIGDAHLLVDYKDFVIRLESFILISIVAGIIPSVMVVRTKILDAIWGSK